MRLSSLSWALPLLQRVAEGWTLEELHHGEGWKRVLKKDEVTFDRDPKYYRVVPPRPQYRLYKYTNAPLTEDHVRIVQRHTPEIPSTHLEFVEGQILSGEVYWITPWLDLPADAYDIALTPELADPAKILKASNA